VTEPGTTGRRGRAGELIVPARLFSDASPGFATEGELSIHASTVSFHAGDAVTELQVSGLVARVGGFDDRTLFLSHPNRPGVEIATSDPAARAAPAIAALPSLAASRQSSRGRRSRFWGCVIAVAVLVILAALALVVGLGLGVGWLRDLF